MKRRSLFKSIFVTPFLKGFGLSDKFGQPDKLPTIIIPLVRGVYPTLLAKDIIGVQPMSGPVGKAFHIRSKYSETGWEIAKEIEELNQLERWL